jgi:hypothetical protein
VQVDTVGQIPAARRAAASCCVGDRWLIVHGGFDGAQCLSDAFVLDTHTLVWARIDSDGGGSSAGQLGPRALHTMVPFTHGLLVYGGAYNNSVLSVCSLLHNSHLTQGHRLASAVALHTGEISSIECKLAECTAERDTHRMQLRQMAAEEQVSSTPRLFL